MGILCMGGTSTGVGKTLVTAGLGRFLVSRGRGVVAIKPVESGCGPEPSSKEDGVRLALCTGQEEPRHALVRLRAPLAPALAAAQEGVALDPRSWVRRIRELSRGQDETLVEGAGGLLSPLSYATTLLDLARDLEAPVLLVAANGLGAINRTLLSLEALERRGLCCLGVVLSAAAPPDASSASNAGVLRRLAPRVRLVELPHLTDPARPAAFFQELAGWLDP